MNTEYAIQMHNITKAFGSYTVLNSINLDVEKGSIHALLGENGAGKTTLMNILYGLYSSDEGQIFINGKELSIKNPNIAIEHGIGMVHQYFMLIENFTVAENIVLGSENTKAFGIIDKEATKKRINKIINKYDLKVDLNAKIEDITIAMEQKVEIIKLLYKGADILIFDEPTSILAPQEIQEFIRIMRELADDGKTIILITHKLKEIKQVADKCTIIRKGKYVDTVNICDVTEDQLASKMMGRSINLNINKTPAEPGNIIFEIKNLFVKDDTGITKVKGLSLKIRKGEIFGITGIDGNGQKELSEAITSLRKCQGGKILINGKEVQNTSTKFVRDNKISSIHENRWRGLIPDFSVADNLIMESYNKSPFNTKGIINEKSQNQFASEIIKEYGIKPENCENLPLRALSGGNQQKIIIAREVANNPDLILIIQPTKGLDISSIEYVHKVLIRERDKGKSILLISLEVDEIMNLADTIAVIHDGKIINTFKQGTVDENTIGLLMAGGAKNANAD